MSDFIRWLKDCSLNGYFKITCTNIKCFKHTKGVVGLRF